MTLIKILCKLENEKENTGETAAAGFSRKLSFFTVDVFAKISERKEENGFLICNKVSYVLS